MLESLDIEQASCIICFDSNEFRVLQCGHAFCLACLKALRSDNESGRIRCPLDRKEDDREPHTLPTPKEFGGKISPPPVNDEGERNMKQLIEEQIELRTQTIRQLRKLASNIDTNEFNCAIAKISGTAAGITGSLMTIAGITLSFTGFGAVFGVPLALAGAVVGVTGGATTASTIVVEQILQKSGLKEMEKDLALDNFKSEQIKVLLVRAPHDRRLADMWEIDFPQLIGGGNAPPRFSSFGVTTAAGFQAVYGIGRAATTTGLHVAGLVLAAAAIPLDIAQMVASSIKIHTKEPSKVVKGIKKMADDLEKQLRIYLISECYFQLLYTNSGQWAYIVIHPTLMQNVKDKLANGCTMEQLEVWGDVIESGQGDVPKEVKMKMQHEWYSHYHELKAEVFKEE